SLSRLGCGRRWRSFLALVVVHAANRVVVMESRMIGSAVVIELRLPGEAELALRALMGHKRPRSRTTNCGPFHDKPFPRRCAETLAAGCRELGRAAVRSLGRAAVRILAALRSGVLAPRCGPESWPRCGPESWPRCGETRRAAR